MNCVSRDIDHHIREVLLLRVGFATKRKVVKAVTVKRVVGKGVTGKGNRFSLVANAQTLSMRELARLQEDLVELSNCRQEGDEKHDAQLPADEISATEVDQSASFWAAFFDAKAQETKTDF